MQQKPQFRLCTVEMHLVKCYRHTLYTRLTVFGAHGWKMALRKLAIIAQKVVGSMQHHLRLV